MYLARESGALAETISGKVQKHRGAESCLVRVSKALNYFGLRN